MDWTFTEALLYLDSRLNYERRGMPDSSNLRIDRVRTLLEQLGSPQSDFKVVHVAGTKGKGSTSTMVAAMLRQAGFRVGLHTSPHFESVRERFVIDGEWISEADFTQLTEEIASQVDAVDAVLPADQPGLTYFEITTAMVMLYFSRQKVDWGVIEVGMGGRLDSTNVVEPEVSVITSIGLDHVKQLGSTYDAIAREKGGIIKPGRPAVIGRLPDSAREVIYTICEQTGSPLYESGRDFHYQYEAGGPIGGSLNGGNVTVTTWKESWPTLSVGVAGEHQGANAAVAIAVMQVLRDAGFALNPAGLRGSLRNLSLPGRVETVRLDPLTIFDVAHNDGSATALATTLKMLWHTQPRPLSPRILLFATTQDKDWRGMVRELAPLFDHVIVTNYLSNPRALPAAEIVREIENEWPVHLAATPALAWTMALQLAQPGGATSEPLICATGSFFLISELKAILSEQSTATSS